MWNKIGDEGAKALVEMLKVNSTLRKLDLQKNDMTNVGGSALVNPLMEQAPNAHLKELNIDIPLAHTTRHFFGVDHFINLSNKLAIVSMASATE